MGKVRSAAAVAAIVVMGLASGCVSVHFGASHPEDAIEFAEAFATPASPNGEPDGVGSVKLVNYGRHAVKITAVEPLPDQGLLVRYVGHSTCNRGCAGAGDWASSQGRLAERSVDGSVPFTLKPNGDLTLHLVFRVTADEASRQRLLAGCPLRVRRVRLKLSNGKKITVSGPDGHIAALWSPTVSTPPPSCNDE